MFMYNNNSRSDFNQYIDTSCCRKIFNPLIRSVCNSIALKNIYESRGDGGGRISNKQNKNRFLVNII